MPTSRSTGWLNLSRRRCATVLVTASLPISGLALAVCLSQPVHPVLAWVSLIPIFAAIRMFSPFEGFCAGALWGMSFFWWAAVVGLAPEVPPTLGSFLALGGLPALYALAGVHLRRRIGYSPFVLAVGWVLVELALHPLGLRHGLLAGAQGSELLVHKLGGLLGYLLVAFLVAYANALILHLVFGALPRILTPVTRAALVDSGRRVAHDIAALPRMILLGLHRARPPPLSG